jgi:ABC-type antimicrobial peptide transport system permease subunit
MALLGQFLNASSIVAAITGGISVSIIVMLSVTQRYQAFGILKASGWSSRDVVRAGLIESLTLSIFGADAGCALGALAVGLMRRFGGTDVVVITPVLIAEVAAFTLIVGVIGVIIPALRAAKGRPVEMFRGGDG